MSVFILKSLVVPVNCTLSKIPQIVRFINLLYSIVYEFLILLILIDNINNNYKILHPQNWKQITGQIYYLKNIPYLGGASNIQLIKHLWGLKLTFKYP